MRELDARGVDGDSGDGDGFTAAPSYWNSWIDGGRRRDVVGSMTRAHRAVLGAGARPP